MFPEAAPGGGPSQIDIELGDFESLHDLLDELFISCLAGRVSPYSYGAEWIIRTSDNLIVAPAGWVRDPTQPIRRMAPEWAASTSLEAAGIDGHSLLRIADPVTVQPYAMVTDSARLARIVVDNPKAMAVLRNHCRVVLDDTYQDRKIQLVLRDWLNLGLTGKVVTDDLTPEALDSIAREYRLD